jgi:uroporphyrinogen decarboxylase
MDKFERLKAVFSGKSTDKQVYSIWKHFPDEDRSPQGFVEAHLRFQKQYNSDLLKLSPHGRYCSADWGSKIGPVHPVYGSTSALSWPIQIASDFENLKQLDPLSGEFGLQVDGVTRVANELQFQVPMMMTIFTPFMIAGELDPDLITHINTAPESVEIGLKIITEVMTEFSKAVLDAGSHGLFVASQHSRFNILTDQQFKDLEMKYTLNLLQAVRNKAEFIVFHLHGDNPRFQEVSDRYPIDGINWHSELTLPTIEQAHKITKKTLLGGIEETQILRKGSKEDIHRMVENIQQRTSPQLILAPGCVIPIDTPIENIQYLIDLINL